MNGLSIRLVEVKDAEALRAIYGYYVEHTHVSFEYTPPSCEEFLERIRATTAAFPWIVCLDKDRVIGYAYAHKHRLRDAYQWSPESSIYLAPDFHTKGIGRIVYNTLLNVLKMQGYNNVFAGVALPNEKSVGLHVKSGFQDIGIFKQIGYKKGKWYDTRWFQLNLQPLSNHPQVPLEMNRILSTAECSELFTQANQQLALINKTS